MRLACCTLPPTRMRWGPLFSSFFTGGGGGGAAEGTAPRMPPMTPPAPPGTPPGTPPTTPALEGGGNSSSLILAISLGIDFGASNLPASNCRGATLQILGGVGAGGG